MMPIEPEKTLDEAGTLPPSARDEAGTLQGSPTSDAAGKFPFLAPPQMPDELGRLGHFRVLKVLGKGGMGVVFQGEDPRLHRSVALKAMLPEVARDRGARERFLREARAAAAIEHDHIVAIYHVDEDRGVPYIAMPLLRGTALGAWLKDRERANKPLTLAHILKIGREIAKGLAAAHDRGLIHRDIKPANIWLDASAGGRVKILDFGVARPKTGGPNITQSGMIIGTPAYMAPEQAQSQAIDGRADLFSLGVVLFRLCAGVLPFQGVDSLAMIMAIATQEPTPLASLRPDLPAELTALVMKLLAKTPEQRPASAADVAKVLQALERRQANAATEAFTSPAKARPGDDDTAPGAKPNDPAASPRRESTATEQRGSASVWARRRWLAPLAAVGAVAVAIALIIQGWPTANPNDAPANQQDAGRKDAIANGDQPMPPVVVDQPLIDFALQFNGRADRVEVADLNLPADSPYTMEARIRPDADAVGGVECRILGFAGQSYLSYTREGYWRWIFAKLKETKKPSIAGAPSKQSGQHVACVFDGKGHRLYLDGKLYRGSTQKAGPARQTPFEIGVGFKGTVDEIRFSRIARYDADFEPIKRFAADKDALALYHCDEGKGEVLNDASGHGNHGKIVGAKWVPAQPPF